MTLDELKKQVCNANLALANSGLVLGTFGNVSGVLHGASSANGPRPRSNRGRDALVVIKPSGMAYEDLTPRRMVVVSLRTGRVVGSERLRPSSDLATHLELYRAFPTVGGVAHTHSLYATAWAQACRPIPVLGTTHADHFDGPIPITRPLRPAEVRDDYERNTGLRLVEAALAALAARAALAVLRSGRAAPDPLRMPAVLVANHGPFTWGGTPAEAVENAVLLEYVASLAVLTLRIRPQCRPISAHLLDKHFSRKHGAAAYYGQKPGLPSRQPG